MSRIATSLSSPALGGGAIPQALSAQQLRPLSSADLTCGCPNQEAWITMKARTLAVLLFAACASPALAQTPVLGGEFPINTYTTDQQISSSVASDHQGNFVVTWSETSQEDIYARRLDANSNPLGPEFRVNSFTGGFQIDSHVSADASGKFVVVWTDAGGSDGSLSGVFGRRFDAAGAPIGSDFPINTYTSSTQQSPAVAVDPSGSFVVVWQSNGADGSGFGVRGRRFNAAGAPLGDEFAVNTYTTDRQSAPRVAAVPSGGFIVVWESQGQDGSPYSIYGRRFDGSGNGSAEFAVNSVTTGYQTLPDLAVSSDGGFVVAWGGETGPNNVDVFARRFASDGTPLGSDFPVSNPATTIELRPRLAFDDEDNLLITWMGFGTDVPLSHTPNAPDGGNPEIGAYARRFGPEGQRIGPQFLVNVYTTGEQSSPAVAAGENGQFVITWESYQDGGFRGIYGRSTGFVDAKPMTVDASASGGTSNVNGVLEPGERVLVAPAYRNRSEAGMTLPGIATNLTGLAGPTYTINDASASYGTIAPDATTDCLEATANCYEFTVAGARPVVHWDAEFDELLEVPGSFDAKKTWALHVGESFPDVPASSPFYPFIENILHHGVTGGGACGPGVYCPQDGVLRQQMAVFLLRSRYGPGYAPPAATGSLFSDVPASNPFAAWIEELYRQGVTGGCGGGPPNPLFYCPTAVVNRQQMAAFLLIMREGAGYAPPPCQIPLFDDVPCSNGFAPFIEALYNQQIAAGCSTNPLRYCPANPTTRQQMAAFLVRTFGLALYGP